ncbi:hypothetical protein, partial [Alcanivorax xiamenensis]|uniref:hypothetical protein n=1 Tax=Alcanivorax xiamenensis TaxID=1177156 RepID=UPI001F16A68B
KAVFASKLVSRRSCYGAAVGSLLASECANAEGRNSPASWSPTDRATKPLWEACWQANAPTPKAGIHQQAGLPQIVPQSRCGKLAGKRITNGRGKQFAAKQSAARASSHSDFVGRTKRINQRHS